jgi:hypothetical protein
VAVLAMVVADELPNVPHLEFETMGNFAEAKIKDNDTRSHRRVTTDRTNTQDDVPVLSVVD